MACKSIQQIMAATTLKELASRMETIQGFPAYQNGSTYAVPGKFASRVNRAYFVRRDQLKPQPAPAAEKPKAKRQKKAAPRKPLSQTKSAIQKRAKRYTEATQGK